MDSYYQMHDNYLSNGEECVNLGKGNYDAGNDKKGTSNIEKLHSSPVNTLRLIDSLRECNSNRHSSMQSMSDYYYELENDKFNAYLEY